MLFKCKNIVLIGCLILLVQTTLTSWTRPVKGIYSNDIGEAVKCLQQCFDTELSKVKIKRYELTITDKGFFRLRKYFRNGKEEYYSFNLQKIAGLDYFGTTANGTLSIKTKSEDIIVQSFHDPKGDIDSMSSVIDIPLKNIEAEQLNMLYAGLVGR